MNVLLTSCGLETDGITKKFLELLPKEPAECTCLFIPTAAVDADAIEALPKCLQDYLKCGCKRDRLRVYDLHDPMDAEELNRFDVVYVCGGNTEYLLRRINERGFREALLAFIQNDGVYVGVSAGSVIAAQNLDNNLGLLHGILQVHCTMGEAVGPLELPAKRAIRLGNRQAIVLTNRLQAEVIE